MKKDFINRGGYVEGIGRRKTSVARVRVSKNQKGFLVNDKDIKDYFKTNELINNVKDPITKKDEFKDFGVSIKVKGGGIASQSDASRHGLTRALVGINETDRKMFKDLGYLTRDPRKKERKKFGLKKARKAGQWSKR